MFVYVSRFIIKGPCCHVSKIVVYHFLGGGGGGGVGGYLDMYDVKLGWATKFPLSVKSETCKCVQKPCK